MSNLEQVITTGIGATIGFFVGGPAGALAGAQYGLLAGSVLFPADLPSVQGPRLEDFERLHADPGSPIAQVYGTAAVAGFRMYLGPVTEIASTEEVGGKGAPSQEVTTFTYLQTIALGLCEGPIAGVLRIWENGELVYDVRPQLDDESAEEYSGRIEASLAYADTFTLYLGTEDQEADPTIETEQGAGNVPGFRGLAYIVFPNRELKPEQGNRHPTYKVEVSTIASVEPEYAVDAFLDPGPFTWTNPGVGTVDVLVVGGGGGKSTVGGEGPSIRGGGGAGGEVAWRTGVEVAGNVSGAVGAGGTSNNPGAPSSFGDIIALGGGSGRGPLSDGAGASGGGGAVSTNGRYDGGVGSVHFDGGDAVGPLNGGASGGGGGAGGPGGPGIAGVIGGAGGPGLDFSDIFPEFGDGGWFGGGGGGMAGRDTLAGPGGRGGGAPGRGVDNDTGVASGLNGAGGGAGGTDSSSVLGKGGDGCVLVRRIVTEGVQATTVPISSIVTAICERAGLAAERIDVSDLEDRMVRGYVVSRETTARAALEPLRMVGRFDYVESGGVLKFPVRGKAPVATLNEDELGVYLEGSEQVPAVTTTRLQDVELPRQIRLRYPSYLRDYERGEQLSPARIGTVGVNDVSVDCPVVLDDDAAARIAEILFREAWASATSQTFQVGPEWHALEPADVALLPVDGRLYRVRIVSIDDAGLLIRRIAATRDDNGSYVSIAVATRPPRPKAVLELIGDTSILLLDIPALREEDDNAGFYLAAWRTGVGQSWTGARIYRSVDDGASYQPIAAIGAQATVGTVLAAPAEGDGYTWDDEGSILVTLEHGELESRTDAAVLGGANAAAIGANGRWQIVQFANAELVSGNTYRLTRLLLGRRGTEHLIGTTQNGDRFVLVSGPGIYRMPLQTAEIGAVRLYRGVTVGLAFDDAESESFTGEGMALECFSPAYVEGDRDTNGDLTISWFRRDRLAQPLRDGVPLGMSEAELKFEVDIIDDSTSETVLRTLVTTDEEVTYTAAQQTEDFGSPQSEITVRVYQISATVGRGIPAEAIV